MIKGDFDKKGCWLLEGDCLDLMYNIPEKSVDLIWTDIPYGEVKWLSTGLVRKSSGLRNLNKGVANTHFDNSILPSIVSSFSRVLTKRGSSYIFCGNKQVSPLVHELDKCGFSVRVGAWNKTNPSPMNGTKIWLSGLEFCVFARREKATFTEHCKKALWDCPSGRNKYHPTEKPVKLITRLIQASSVSGDIVFDPFMGSGSTGVACVNTGRRFIGIELDPGYFTISVNRISEATGVGPVIQGYHF